VNGDAKPEAENIGRPKVYKGITKDQWRMVGFHIAILFHLGLALELISIISQIWSFLTTISSDLSDYDSDSGWPTLLDEFVAWKRAKLT
jgi:DCN1-like protein 4/5